MDWLIRANPKVAQDFPDKTSLHSNTLDYYKGSYSPDEQFDKFYANMAIHTRNSYTIKEVL